jgi:acetyl esterase/lipase
MKSIRRMFTFRSGLTLAAVACAVSLSAQDETTPTVSFPPPGGTPAAAATEAPANAPPAVELPTAPLPIVDFMRSPQMRGPQLNDAGSHLAALFSQAEANYQLVVRDMSTGQDIFLGGGDRAIVDEFNWLDDTHIAYNLVTPSGADLALMVADVTDPAGAYPIYQYGSARIVVVPPDDPLMPLVWVSVGTAEGEPAVVQLDAGTDRGGFIEIDAAAEDEGLVAVAERHAETIQSVVPLPEGSQLGYLPDGAGSIGYAYTAVDGEVVLNVWDGQEWFRSPLGFDNARLVDVGEEPGQILMAIRSPDGKPSILQFVSAVTGELGEVLLQDSNYDFNGSVFRDPSTNAIVGAFYDRTGPTAQWFDQGYRDLQQSLNNYFPGRVVRLVDMSTDANVMILAVTSDRDPVVYFTLEVAEKRLEVLSGERPWLPGSQLSPTSILKYTTADGKQLDAYVTLPKGTTKETPAPLIVLPHGGPFTRTSWGFDSEAQLLANRGYAVLQPNYRGSTGYDWMFSDRERADVLMMHEDVTRAVRTVIRTGMIDPDRIGISGGGFGGYLALTGLVEEPDLYRAGVTVAGIFDWQRLANEIGENRDGHPTYGELFVALGDPGSEAARYDAVSSGRRVDQMEAPVLVVRNREGQTLEDAESAELIDDLLSAGVNHEVHNIDGSVAQLDSRVALFERILQFFDRHLQ